MSFYLYELSYSAEAIRAMIAHPSDRKAAAQKIITAAGGKLHHMSFAFGTSDVICLIEAPDDKTVAAIGMIIGASGTISSAHTTKLIPVEDALAAMKMAGTMAGAYSPPMS